MLTREKPLILVVDDDVAVRKTILYMLLRDGYEVIEAENGMQAIEAYKSLHPDIILLDIMMPVMDGISVCNEIRKLPDGKYVPILMVTCLNDNESVTRAFNAGATEFITKPIHNTVLRHRVRLLLNAKLTEDALKKSEEHFRRFSENASDIIYRFNLLPVQQFEYLSPSIEKITGYPPEVFYLDVEMFLQCVHSEDRNATIVGSKVTGDIATNAVFRLVCSDGKIKWLETKRVLVYGNDGNSISVEGIMRDITERKQLEEELVKAKNVAEIGFARLNAIITNLGAGILLVDKNEVVVEVNDFVCSIHKRKREELIGQLLWDIVPATIHTQVHDKIEEFKKDLVREPIFINTKSLGMDIMLRVQPVINNDSYAGVLLNAIDITPIAQAQRETLKEKEFSEKILQTAATAIFIVSPERKIALVNDEFCKITGYKREEVLGRDCNIIGVNCSHEKCFLFDPCCKESVIQSHFEMIIKDGRKLTILKKANLLRDNAGLVVGGIESFVDITELVRARREAEKARKQAEHLASTDYLTGLLNRRVFEERLAVEYERAKRSEIALSVIIADIDYFKDINDKYGHQVGDTVLQIFATTLSQCCRPYDFVGRYGGEEFIICLPKTDREQAVIVAERMRTNVQDMQISVPTVNRIIKITSSFGLSELKYDSQENTDILISRADDALYQAKGEGRNKVCSLC